MIVRLLELVLRLKTVIWALVAAAVVASAFMLTRAPLDAIPDISDPQIVVYVKWPRSPQLLESNVNEPIIRALVGAPGVQSIRGTSHMQVVAVRPNGGVEPLIWLYEYRNRYRHPFLFRSPITLPSGTVIRGLPSGATITLLQVP